MTRAPEAERSTAESLAATILSRLQAHSPEIWAFCRLEVLTVGLLAMVSSQSAYTSQELSMRRMPCTTQREQARARTARRRSRRNYGDQNRRVFSAYAHLPYFASVATRDKVHWRPIIQERM